MKKQIMYFILMQKGIQTYENLQKTDDTLKIDLTPYEKTLREREKGTRAQF